MDYLLISNSPTKYIAKSIVTLPAIGAQYVGQYGIICEVEETGVAYVLHENGVWYPIGSGASVAVQATATSSSSDYVSTKQYRVGDYTKRNGNYYRCISDTSGNWNSSKWTAVQLSSIIATNAAN